MLEETEREETRGFFVTFLSLETFQLEALPSSGYVYVLGSFGLKMRKLLAISEAEFNSSIGAGMGTKPSGTKVAVIFAFRK